MQRFSGSNNEEKCLPHKEEFLEFKRFAWSFSLVYCDADQT